MAQSKTAYDGYWDGYDGLQAAKHAILRNYLGAWFPILASWSGRILYIDCHAGRGRHTAGQAGSLLVALDLLLNHKARDRILARTEVVFVLLENNEHNFDELKAEVEAIGELPETVVVHAHCEDYEARLRQIREDTRGRGTELAPLFAFVDPFGFKLSMATLNDMLSSPASEILVNFMFRYVQMAIQNDSQEANMDLLFGTGEWRGLRSVPDKEARTQGTIDLFSRQLKAEYVTHMYMRSSRNVLKYVLFHASNHRRGREKMKEAMWKAAPVGDFTAFERSRPDQIVLFTPEPDLSPLRSALWGEFAGEQVDMGKLYEWLLGGFFLKKHLHKVLSEYRKADVLSFSDYEGRFAFGRNPTVTFPSDPPSMP